ncbi:MAG: PKD domain-containing protein, partial [Chitinophagales bacterium]
YSTDVLQKQVTVQASPTLQVTPDNIHLTLMAGNSANRTVNLSNIGAGDLYFGTETRVFEEDTLVEKFHTQKDTTTYLFENVHPFSQFRLEVTINGDFDATDEYMWLRIEGEDYKLVGIHNASAENGTDIKEVYTYNVADEEVQKWLEDQQLKVEIWHGIPVGFNEGGEDFHQIRLVTDHDDWLKAAKNGVVEGETNEELQVIFDASNLWAGIYTNELQILTNESVNPQKNISCTLEVLANPVAFFEQVGNVSCEGSVEFRDQSINHPDTWEWDFGDGTMISNEQNPTHQFAAKGDYMVSLKVCKDGVCDETTQNIFIAPSADFSLPSNDVPFNREVTFSNLSQGGTSYFWDFGDGMTSTEKHPKHLFEASGTYEVQLTTETCFESDTKTKTIQIQAAPQASIPTETLNVTLNAGEQNLQKVVIQNNGMGALYYDASLQRTIGKSTKTFDSSGDRTIHIFEEIGEGASDFLQLKITLNGDFDATNERVWLRLDGEGMEYVLDNNTESAEDETHIITLYPPVYKHLLADGQLLVELENTEEVEARSDRTNQHKVELIGNGVPWLSLLKENETIEANGIDSLEIVFDASQLNAGIYDFPLEINTNEPANTPYTIPTQLEVLGMASMELSAATIDFGTVRVNESISKPFEVFNAGTDTLFVTSMGAQSPVFEADTMTLVLPPKTAYEGILTFTPTSIDVFGENFEIQSNVGTQTISLMGTAIGAPKISVSPDSLF